MGTSRSRSITLPDPAATERFAAALARTCTAGDTILLDGPVGSGKSHLARAFIRTRLEDGKRPPEDVPSPTFTLVQTYEDGATEIWHSDLYRLTSPEDVLELGLDEAFHKAIVLIEWPDRLGDAAPPGALTLTLRATGSTGRTAVLSSDDPDWLDRLEGLHA